MKKILLFIVFCSLINTTYSQTYVIGIISTNNTWTLASSPYIVVGNVQIPSTIKLTIEAGVTIKFLGDYEIAIKGALVANGTQKDSIKFSSGATQIRFTQANLSNSQLNYVKMELGSKAIFTDAGNSGTLNLSNFKLDNTQLTVSSGNISLQNSSISNGTVNLSNCYQVNVTIDSSKIYNATLSIDYRSSGNLIVSNSFIENSIVSGDPNVTSCNVKVLKSKLLNSCISACVSAKFDIIGCILLHSNIYGYAYSDLNVSNTIILYNGSKNYCRSGGPTGNFGILTYDYEYPKNLNVSNSTIIGSGTGIYMSDGSVSKTTLIGNNIAIKVGSRYATISNTNFIKTALYNLLDSGTTGVIAERNYWGSDKLVDIKKQIYDGFSDINLGEVDYSNYKSVPDTSCPLTPPTNLIKSNVLNGVKLSWNPNAESDLAGYKIYYGTFDGFTFSNSVDVGIDTTFTLYNKLPDDLILITAYDKKATGIDNIIQGHESWYSNDVTPKAKITNGDSIKICQGSKTILHANKSDSYKYQWLKDGVAISGATNDSIEISVAGKYQVMETNINNVSNTSSNFLVKVHQLTAQNANLSIICGASLTLSPSISYTGNNIIVYAWDVDNTLSAINIKNPVVNIISSHSYKLSITDNVCSANLTVNVTVNPLTVNAGSDKSLVCGGKVQFDNPITNYTGIGTLTYSWLPTTGLDNATISRPTAEITSNASYALVVSTTNGCIAKDTVKVIVTPFTVNAGSDKSIICGGKVQFDNPITNYTGSGTLNYSWLPKTGLDSAKLAKPTAEITSNAKYVLTLTTPNGCIAKDSVLVTVNPLTVNAGSDKSLICGEKVQFDNPYTNYTGSGILNYSWLPKTGLDSAKLAKPTAEITSNAKYVLTLTTPNGCIAKDSVLVTVNPLTVNAGSDKSLICGGKVQFDNPYTNYTGSGILNYSWLPKTGLDSAILPAPTAEINSNKNYILTLTTPNGCIAIDSVNVTVNPLTASANDIIVSCGNTAQLNVTSNYTGSGGLLYNWSPSLGLSATNIYNPVASVKTKTKYAVEVKTLNGCSASYNVNVSTSIIDFKPSICMVTVNENDKNVVVWQIENNNAIDSFLIYRESSSQTGQYILIGKVPYFATSVFVDTTSNARVQSNKYKIASKDVCGFITDKSSEHKTMHLTINKGNGNIWNLIWEQYFGLSVSGYKIYRGTNKSNLTLIGTSSNSNTTYTDETAPAGDVYYQIEVVLPQACTNLKTTGYESSRSNIMSSADVATGIIENSMTQLFIYPNPAFDKLYIKNSNSLIAKILLFDMQGKQLMSKEFGTGGIDISGLSKGIYIVKLIDSGNILINRFIKE